MKNKIALVCFAIVLAVSSCSFTTKKFDTDSDKDKVLIELITYVIEQGHYDMRKVDNDFSKNVYNDFLESLDPMKRHFTRKDIKDFDDYKTEIDDQIREKEIDFFNIVYNRYQEKLEETKAFYLDILEEGFDLNSNENINTNYEELEFVKNTKTLKERWRKQLKFSLL